MRILRKAMHVPVGDLAELYGVSQTTVANIIRGHSYPDAGGPIEDHGTRMYKPREKKPREPRPHTPDEGRKHGTAWGVQWGCKCEECRAANAQKSRDYRARKKKEKEAKLAAADFAAREQESWLHRDTGGADLASAG